LDIDTPQQSATIRFGWLSVGVWIGLTFAGFLLGIFFHFPGDSEFYVFDRGAALAGFVFGAISGLIAATMQWIVLKPWLRSPWLWLALNAIGWGLVHAINDGIALPLQRTFVLAALIVALAQYAVLRPLLSNAILWVPLAVIAWFLGFQCGEWLYNGEDPGNLIVAGLVVGVITGVALHFLLIPTIHSRLSPSVSTPLGKGT
jgi:hypothetical protein